MQSAVVLRGGDTMEAQRERLDQGVASRTAFQRKLDGDDEDLLDDNDMERILSRPALPRRKVELFEAPEFVQRLSSYQEASIGDKVTFSGQYKAFPKPTVKWFKDEEEVKETKRHNLDLSSEASGIVRLIINEVIKQDEGAYKCKVENQEGVASTTGYLSVSGKPSDKSNSPQTKKLAQERISTPPYLRPIVEQKSMEEREEKEYQCLPPSPLQEFMDKIRHSAKSMHGPIVYADLADVYPDDEVIKDFGANDGEEEEDVFGDEQNTSTPSGSPVTELLLEEAFNAHKEKHRQEPPRSIQVIDEFVSPLVDLKSAAFTTQSSNDDSAYDSDNQEPQTPTNKVKDHAVNEEEPLGKNRRNHKMKLTLQRSHALEITDADVIPPSNPEQHGTTTNPDSENQLGATFAEKKPVSKGDGLTICVGVSEKNDTITETLELQRSVSESLLDLFFRCIDSPWCQLYVGFVVSTTALALAAEIPPAYLIAVVFLLTIASLIFFERHQNCV